MTTAAAPKVTAPTHTQMYIDGSWCDAADGGRLAVINPADESTIAEVAFGGRADAERGHRRRREGPARLAGQVAPTSGPRS